MSTNVERVCRADYSLHHYRSLAGNELTDDQAITDLVADIGHYCIEHDLAFQYLLAEGISHWRLEMTDPQGLGPLPEVTITISESDSHA